MLKIVKSTTTVYILSNFHSCVSDLGFPFNHYCYHVMVRRFGKQDHRERCSGDQGKCKTGSFHF